MCNDILQTNASSQLAAGPVLQLSFRRVGKWRLPAIFDLTNQP